LLTPAWLGPLVWLLLGYHYPLQRVDAKGRDGTAVGRGELGRSYIQSATVFTRDPRSGYL